ncbi:hypothetical protein HQ585_10345 [candidate division KSB1 bacterium]|nr:hypothetical protein [candidate division KSB1 bacterium]
MDLQTTYFDKPGSENTEQTLKLVKEWADRLSIGTLLVASTSGKTGALAVDQFQSHRIVVVSHATGFNSENEQEMLPEYRSHIEANGGVLLTCPHAFAGVGRGLRLKFGTHGLEDIIANTLRIMGEGIKVAVEIAMMATDAGLIRTDESVISVAGSAHGTDTAAVIRPTNTFSFFDMQLQGILCKPWIR